MCTKRPSCDAHRVRSSDSLVIMKRHTQLKATKLKALTFKACKFRFHFGASLKEVGAVAAVFPSAGYLSAGSVWP
eukprot:1491861-Amphidinium_carterae.1